MQPTGRRQRVKFNGISYQSLPDGSSRISVELEWEETIHRGEGIGTGTLEGDLRASGEATARAAQSCVGDLARINLLGIKAVRAFDSRVIIAAVEVVQDGRHQKLLGAHALTGGDLPREAALTVLDALNRVLGPLAERAQSNRTGDAYAGRAEAEREP